MYRATGDCIEDLERTGQLVRIRYEVDGYLEAAAIHLELQKGRGPAVYFEKIKGSRFPAVSNLFGTQERCEFIFRKTLARTSKAIAIKADPMGCAKNFWKFWDAPWMGWTSLPKKVSPTTSPVMQHECSIEDLPKITCWPEDGGPFITLPQVLSYAPGARHPLKTNLGMYRIQLSGNDYVANREIGLHYQIHRGMGVHHAVAAERNENLKVAVLVGGPPAHTVAAVMPLPEGLSELVFAGMLSGSRFRYCEFEDWFVASEADFCILGDVAPSETKMEGPFGDHLGYYSLKHPFPVLKVQKVFHRSDAVWPFTVVGRPPQEDSQFGHLIHRLTKPMVPVSLPGVRAMHAVDEAGVHPLLLAVGSERYTPYQVGKHEKPAELMTQAYAILGFNQASLAKYLMIINGLDVPQLSVSDTQKYFEALLQRVDWFTDLHFQTNVTMDTLDYSGTRINEGSKVIIAARGDERRKLADQIAGNELVRLSLNDSSAKLAVVAPGILALQINSFVSYEDATAEFDFLNEADEGLVDQWPFIVICDDADFVAQSFANFLWVTFTRSQPSHDIYGVKSFTQFKHWGCRGSLVIDARIKPHHAKSLEMPPSVKARAEAAVRALGLVNIKS
jgi:4-hydroxy-3-polyprenylbenzoate decarboxylase